MLWSLFKIILFVCAVAAMTFGAAYLLESSGGIRIEVATFEYSLGPLQSVIALVLLLVGLWLLLKLLGLLRATWLFINGDETAMSRYFARNRLAKGYDALADGMMALASGEGRLALVKAERANKYLDRPELTNLLTAQAAELSGDKKKAEETYRKLITDDRTRFVGVRGILKQRLADGDTETALELAKTAFALKPKHEETQDVLLRLQADNEDWSGARDTLAAKLKHGSLPRDVHKRRDAVLALSAAKASEDTDEADKARETAIQANRLSPMLVPAAVMAAQAYLDKGQKRQAIKTIKKAWTELPHPDLASAFAAVEPDETPAERLKRFQPLIRIKPDDLETRMLRAELNIAAEDFPEAQRAIGDLAETNPSVRVATLMAAIEKGQGASDSVVKGWLARAVTAPRGPSWVCDNCQHVQGEWNATCSNCGSLDTLTWRLPPEREMILPGGADMLPLLIASDEEEGGDIEDLPVASDVAEAKVEETKVDDIVEATLEDSETEDKKKADA